MSAKHWPANLFPSSVGFEIVGQSASGGRSDTGFEQVVVGSAGYLTAILKFVGLQFRKPERTLAARAMKAHLRGRANSVYMPIYDRWNSPAALAGEDSAPEVLTLDDESLFDDDTGLLQDPTPAQAGPASRGQGTLLVYMLGGHTPQPGQWFGLKGKEAYLIDTAERVIEGADYHTLTFSPTLRRDVVDGERVDFDDPHVEMRAQSDQVAAIAFSFPAAFSGFTLELTEVVP